MTKPSYTISADGKSITCHKCGRTSHHPTDVKERFCGNCHIFHDDGGAQGLTLPTQKLDSANHFEVLLFDGGIGARILLRTITPAEAINLAVWLKGLADPSGEEFARVEKEVRNS